MNNIVKIETYTEFPYNMVEWKLHDKCNYNCYFCGDENKLGRVGWSDLDTNKSIVDSIVKSSTKPLWVQLTGGEPTLYPHFIELLAYMKQKSIMTRVISNGSRTLRWWKELKDANVVDLLYLTFHSQQNADYRHIQEVANLFLDTETITVILVTYVPETLEYALEGAKYLTENTGSYISANAMDLADDELSQFHEEQFDQILNQYNISHGKLLDQKQASSISPELLNVFETTIMYSDGTSQVKDVTLMMKLGENKFKGWTCSAGLDTMNIENGFKYRGGCKRDKTAFSLENLSFFDKPFVCDVPSCFCAIDMITTKIKNSD